MEIKEKCIINIGRQLGSGGRLIGNRLAKAFNIRFYDKELIDLAVRESGIDKKFFEQNDEQKGFFGAVYNVLAPLSGGLYPYDNQLSQESLFKIQSDAIRKAAQESSCVFVGRCADYVLRDNPRCVNIFISANETDRIKRICKQKGITAHEAQKKITQGDEHRAAYYNYYSTNTWGAADTYHLCINSSVLGIEQTTELLKDFIIRKLNL